MGKKVYRKDGSRVIGELCACGHRGKDHGSKLRRRGGTSFRTENDGGCCCPECRCNKFQWTQYLVRERRSVLDGGPPPDVGEAVVP